MFALVPASKLMPAFILPHGSSWLTLTHNSFVSYLRVFLQNAGYDPTQYSGHSFRRGGCTFASQCGVPAHLLKIHGDWISNAFEQYLDLPLQARLQVMQRIQASLIAE